MGGVWVDYNLMTTISGCYCIGEANFLITEYLGWGSDIDGVFDGYFVLPYTIGDYLSSEISTGEISTDTKEFEELKDMFWKE